MENSVPPQFLNTIRELMTDRETKPYLLSTADLMVIMSSLLGAYAMSDTPEPARDSLMTLAREISDYIEARHPTSEPYLAFLFGLAAFTNARWR